VDGVTVLGADPSTVDSSAVEVDEVLAWTDDLRRSRTDVLAAEEPLEIRLAGYSVAVTMRTPGDDFDLASGFLFTEGIIRSPADVASIAHCPTDDLESATNIVNVNPNQPDLVRPERWQRNFFVTSSCGVCGKASIESVRQEAPRIVSQTRISPRTLYRLADAIREAQIVFDQTGGLHAAALFTADGTLLTLREDVGRHNAVDKVIGNAFRQASLPLDDHVLMVSGRTSFEIVQKALMAGFPIVAAVSAPSSLAVELACAAGMTLIGFLRASDGTGRFNVYTGAERIADG
jgi:FdhD protein